MQYTNLDYSSCFKNAAGFLAIITLYHLHINRWEYHFRTHLPTRWHTRYTMGQLAISEICNHHTLQQTLKVISCIKFRDGLTAWNRSNKSYSKNTNSPTSLSQLIYVMYVSLYVTTISFYHQASLFHIELAESIQY